QAIGKNGDFQGGLVFAGYGITANEEGLKYDDFAGLDVQGKVVIVVRKEPQLNDPKSPFDGTSPSQFALFTAKETNAAKHEVAALILVNDQNSEQANPDTVLPVSGAGLPVSGAGTAVSKDQVPTFVVRRSDVETWIKESGNSLIEIESRIDQDLVPRSFVMDGWKANGRVELKKLSSMNVVGVLPGQGTLTNEYIVLGAHFDHVGMGGRGSLTPGTIAVHNGADDNASGTVCLLEAARQLSLLARTSGEDVPRRTLVFIAFSGEELNLLGSGYYVKHPRFELENTVAMLNMDMVGRLTNNDLTIYGTGSATEFDAIITKANDSAGFAIQRQPEGMGPSDHQSFFQNNIPVLHFFTGLHDDYHRPSDDFDKININGINRITGMVTTIVNQLTTDTLKPTFVKVKGRANPQATMRRRTTLGVRLNLKVPDVVIEKVLDGIAMNAGIQPGDKILNINNDETTSRAELDRILRKLKKGDFVEFLVERGEEKMALKAQVTE
ncbi:MAG TPA: M28 family peptidase, partial [Pirellula sp.]|nr:M28 family peptidase [Pirellula sp.]